MPTNYTDQFFIIDPSAPPAGGTTLNPVSYTLVDQNDNGLINRFSGDSVNGLDITDSFPGDTVTIFVPGVGNVTYTGITFYLANGQVVFTPTDGQVLQSGTFVSSTSVTSQGSLDVDDLGPPCFTLGTFIRTPKGEVPVEMLGTGDLVETADRGPQPIRWLGRSSVAGTGDFAPVEFAEGALGNTEKLLVSPQHRMLVTGKTAELYLGEPEVLVAAKHLTCLPGVKITPMRRVTYLHILFDQHEIVFSNSVLSESFHPGGVMLERDLALRAEIAAIFPDCPALHRATPLPIARPVMRGREAPLLTL